MSLVTFYQDVSRCNYDKTHFLKGSLFTQLSLTFRNFREVLPGSYGSLNGTVFTWFWGSDVI